MIGDLDQRYAALSKLVGSVLGMNLEELASRAPLDDYEYFDLERLLAHKRDNDRIRASEGLLSPFSAQVRGYLATLDAYVRLDVIKQPRHFILKKLAAPKTARPMPTGHEMLDTLAECSWGLWLHSRHGNLEEERLLPDGLGNSDFFVTTASGPLWVDCISIAPEADLVELTACLSKIVKKKWRRKFGDRAAAGFPTAIAVTTLKMQEHVLPWLRHERMCDRPSVAPASLWASCPGLSEVWLGRPPWHDGPQHPDFLASWKSERDR